MDQPAIEVLLFDLGNVILPFNHHQIAEKLAPYSSRHERPDPAAIFSYLFDLHQGLVNDFETGRLGSQAFFDSVRKAFDLELSFDRFVPIWNEIFSENHEVSALIRSLKGRRKLGLLSNTNALHFEFIRSRFRIVRSFDRWILSHEVGSKKPAPEIYREAIRWASVAPGKILFIDDTQRNIEGAAALGIQTIRFVSAQELKEELSARLPMAHGNLSQL
jgi:HAD superfamily hydrolase (TIGR01509 family)